MAKNAVPQLNTCIVNNGWTVGWYLENKKKTEKYLCANKWWRIPATVFNTLSHQNVMQFIWCRTEFIVNPTQSEAAKKTLPEAGTPLRFINEITLYRFPQIF